MCSYASHHDSPSGHVYSVIMAAAFRVVHVSVFYTDVLVTQENTRMETVVIKIKLSFNETDLGSYVETLEAS